MRWKYDWVGELPQAVYEQLLEMLKEQHSDPELDELT